MTGAEKKEALCDWIAHAIPESWRRFPQGLRGRLMDHINCRFACEPPRRDRETGKFGNIDVSKFCDSKRRTCTLQSFLSACQKVKPGEFSQLLSSKAIGPVADHLAAVLTRKAFTPATCHGASGVGDIVMACEALDGILPMATYDRTDMLEICRILAVPLADDLPCSRPNKTR